MTPQRTDGHKNKIVVGMKILDSLLGRKRLRQSSRCATIELADYSAFLLAEIIMSYYSSSHNDFHTLLAQILTPRPSFRSSFKTLYMKAY